VNVNNKQRVVLILGAGALLYVLLTSPKISIVKGTYVKPPPDKENIAKMIDVRTTITRVVAVLGATLLVCVALKGQTRKSTQPTTGGETISVENCQENSPQRLKKDTLPKIIKFLKDFF
jgi:hypothetical protein